MMAMICLPILICAAILLFRKTEATASRYLAAFLFAAVLAVTPQIIGYAGFYDVWPGLTYFPLFSTELWLGPLIYLHADRLMRGGPLGRRKYLLMPGILQSIYYLWAFFGLGNYQDKWAYNEKTHLPYILPVENILTIALFLFAIIAIWRLVKSYRYHLDQTSSAALDYDPVWLRNLIIMMILAGGIFVVMELINLVRPLSYNAAFPFQAAAMMFVAWIGIEAVWRLNKSFPKRSMSEKQMSETENQVSENWTDAANMLKDKVISENWFLEPGLSIRDLAARMGTNETYLSRTLNRGMGKSFNRFINELRVDFAKTKIARSSGSILTIAFDSGFNSKATFNRVFRDISGQTPTQYKKSQIP